ncbi:hypothetical protein L0F63_000141 [Massospora cicadina]|nr:hypothetical protein L0F63_000141 [Massospora cicadina]
MAIEIQVVLNLDDEPFSQSNSNPRIPSERALAPDVLNREVGEIFGTVEGSGCRSEVLRTPRHEDFSPEPHGVDISWASVSLPLNFSGGPSPQLTPTAGRGDLNFPFAEPVSLVGSSVASGSSGRVPPAERYGEVGRLWRLKVFGSLVEWRTHLGHCRQALERTHSKLRNQLLLRWRDLVRLRARRASNPEVVRPSTKAVGLPNHLGESEFQLSRGRVPTSHTDASPRPINSALEPLGDFSKLSLLDGWVQSPPASERAVVANRIHLAPPRVSSQAEPTQPRAQPSNLKYPSYARPSGHSRSFFQPPACEGSNLRNILPPSNSPPLRDGRWRCGPGLPTELESRFRLPSAPSPPPHPRTLPLASPSQATSAMPQRVASRTSTEVLAIQPLARRLGAYTRHRRADTIRSTLRRWDALALTVRKRVIFGLSLVLPLAACLTPAVGWV